MAFDEELAWRLRERLAGEAGVSEKRMFGGCAFLVNGNIAVSASGQGGLMVRVDPDQSEDLVRRTAAERMVMRGRSMDGWLRVPSTSVRTAKTLDTWVTRGVTFARTLPGK